VWKSKFYGTFVLNLRVVLHAIDAPPARWRGDAGSSSLRNDLVKNYRVHPTHWLISTQPPTMQWATSCAAAALTSQAAAQRIIIASHASLRTGRWGAIKHSSI
jgi:hypothetical protein